jgi:hypothetical protein
MEPKTAGFFRKSFLLYKFIPKIEKRKKASKSFGNKSSAF